MTARNDSGDGKRDASDSPGPVDKLSEQARRLKQLTELRSLKDDPLDIFISPEDLQSLIWAGDEIKKDLDRVRKGMEENQTQLNKLLMRIESFWGATQGVRESLESMKRPPGPQGIAEGQAT
jgi:hypothetical protein